MQQGAVGSPEDLPPSCGILSGSRSLWSRMAQELSEKELLKMEVEQLKKEVKNPRTPVGPLFPSPPLFSITSGSSQSWDPKGKRQAGGW